MGFDMKIKTTLKTTAVVVSLATLSSYTFAEGQVRGAMSAVNHVASAIVVQNGSEALKWGRKATNTGSVVNASAAPEAGGIRWADKRSFNNSDTAVVETGSGAVESGSKWVLRNTAEQTGSKWVLRNTVEQTGSKWVLR